MENNKKKIYEGDFGKTTMTWLQTAARKEKNRSRKTPHIPRAPIFHLLIEN